MIIDYNKIEEQEVMNFRGGEGLLITKNFVDGKNKIMMSRLKPGASSGYHIHEQNSEIVYILSGKGHFRYDETEEPFKAGDVHYCPMGHSHAMYNDGEDDLVYFAIVPEHH
jgi:mannose-6-phosphate isomerase-like protein (cupin superfamily)